MNVSQFPFIESVGLFSMMILVNEIIFLVISISLILLIAFGVYRLTRRKEQPEVTYAIPQWQSNYADPQFYFDIAPADFKEEAIKGEDVVEPDNSELPPMMDELTMPVKVPSFTLEVVASLQYVRGGENLPERLSIIRDQPALFGRSKSVCDHVLDDVRVSRLHAKITQNDGHFYIQDEGSSGGTFVNQQRLSVAEKLRLSDGDLINFNEVAYLFTLKK